MLLPALGHTKQIAIASNCRGNLKQLGLGLLNYANDWDGWGPARVYSVIPMVVYNNILSNYFGIKDPQNTAFTAYNYPKQLGCPGLAKDGQHVSWRWTIGAKKGEVDLGYIVQFGYGNGWWNADWYGRNANWSGDNRKAAMVRLEFAGKTVRFTSANGSKYTVKFPSPSRCPLLGDFAKKNVNPTITVYDANVTTPHLASGASAAYADGHVGTIALKEKMKSYVLEFDYMIWSVQ